MTQSLNSQDLVAQVELEIANQVRQLRSKNIDPHLAAVVVGENSRFVELKQRRGHTLGIETSIYRLPATSQLDDVASVIGFLNVDPSVHGILVQLPLPDHFTPKQTDQIIAMINPAKDVDGSGPGRDQQPAKSLTDLVRATHLRHRFLPTTAWAMLQLAEGHKIPLEHCLIVGHGRLVGAPLDQLLDQLKIPHQIVDEDSPQRTEQIPQANTILAGTNATKPIFNRKTVGKDVAIIAAGDEIDHDGLENWARALTPHRGGVGPLTIALLLQQTVIAATHG